jgi:hypothetical protein
MGLIIDDTKIEIPYIESIKHNIYIDEQKIWNNAPTGSFEFLVADAGSFGIPVSGVNGGTSTYQSYNWKIDWGDGSTESASGTGSNNKTISHTYSDGVGSHIITIKPKGTETQGWFNAFGSSFFQSTSNLTKIKQLYSPITSLMRTMNSYAYHSMFYKCTGLTSLPENLLPATTLAEYCCYYMFYGCTGLTTLPSGLLPATTLANDCYYYMFSSCIGLTSLPENLLPATTLASYCYQNMFYNCTGLISIPDGLLPATTLADYCYTQMFHNCTELTALPSGLLPATTLDSGCYYEMFCNCSKLTTLPNNLLPATTLVGYCYAYMFYGCNKLSNIGNINAAWFTARASMKQVGMFYNCTVIATPITYANIPSGWK